MLMIVYLQRAIVDIKLYIYNYMYIRILHSYCVILNFGKSVFFFHTFYFRWPHLIFKRPHTPTPVLKNTAIVQTKLASYSETMLRWWSKNNANSNRGNVLCIIYYNVTYISRLRKMQVCQTSVTFCTEITLCAPVTPGSSWWEVAKYVKIKYRLDNIQA